MGTISYIKLFTAVHLILFCTENISAREFWFDYRVKGTQNILRCRALCTYMKDCDEFKFDPATKRCFLLQTETILPTDFGSPPFLSEEDIDSVVSSENQCTNSPCNDGSACALQGIGPQGYICVPIEGQWKYVFGAKNGTGSLVYEKWIDGAYTCTDSTCPVYKDGMINNWGSLNIDMIMVVLYVGSETVAWLKFDGSNSDNVNWFTDGKLLASSWNDILNLTKNYFRIHDLVDTQWRRFYISNNWDDCPGDTLWFVVSENVGGPSCLYDQVDSFPQFQYSRNNVVGGVTDLRWAEWFKIFILQK